MPVAAYGVERVIYVLWSATMLIMTSLQLASHYCQRTSPVSRIGGNGGTMMAGDRRHFVFGKYRVAAATPMNGRNPSGTNGAGVAATLKLRYHQYTFGVAVWLAVMMPDPQSVYELIPAGIWPIVIRNVELLLLAYYITSQHSQLSLLYAPRPVPSCITHAMKSICIAFAIMAIVLPILQLAMGWQLFLVILIFMFDLISFIMPILSVISLIRVRRLVTGLVTYGATPPQSQQPGRAPGIPSTNGNGNGNNGAPLAAGTPGNTNGNTLMSPVNLVGNGTPVGLPSPAPIASPPPQPLPSSAPPPSTAAIGMPPIAPHINIHPHGSPPVALHHLPRKSDSIDGGQRTPASFGMGTGTPPPLPVTVLLTTPQGMHTTTLVSSAAAISTAAQVRAKVFRAALRRLTIGVIGTTVIFFAGIIYDALLLRQRLPHLFSPVESVSPDHYALPIAHFLLLLAESFLIWYSWVPLSKACGSNGITNAMGVKVRGSKASGNDKNSGNNNNNNNTNMNGNGNGNTNINGHISVGGTAMMVTSPPARQYNMKSALSRGGTATAVATAAAPPLVDRWMRGTPTLTAMGAPLNMLANNSPVNHDTSEVGGNGGGSHGTLPLLPPPLIIPQSSPGSIHRQSIHHLPMVGTTSDGASSGLPSSGGTNGVPPPPPPSLSPVQLPHHLPSSGSSSGIAATTEEGGNDNDIMTATLLDGSNPNTHGNDGHTTSANHMMIYDTSHLSNQYHQPSSAEEFI